MYAVLTPPCGEDELHFSMLNQCCPEGHTKLRHGTCMTEERYEEAQNSDEALRTGVCSGAAVIGLKCAPGAAPGY